MKPSFLRISLCIFLCVSGLWCRAQDIHDYLHSYENIEAGTKLYDDGKYEEALAKDKMVNPSDSNYASALYESSMSLLALKRYDEAIAVCRKTIALNKADDEAYNNLGTAYDEKNQEDSALAIYNRGLSYFPYSDRLWYNKAIVYERNNQRDKALEVFKDHQKFNPFYPSDHLELARTCWAEKHYAQAIMSYVTFLIIEPNSPRSLEALHELNDLCNGNEYKGDGKTHKPAIKSEFSDLDFLIGNRIAMNKKYKVPSDFNIAAVRQTYFVIDQLSQKKDLGDGYWAKFYAPFFTQDLVKKNYDLFTLIMMASNTSPEMRKRLIRKLNKVKAYEVELLKSWLDLHQGFDVEIGGKQLHLNKYYETTFHLSSFGNKDGDDERDGPWEFF